MCERWPSRPVRSLRYIVTCTRKRDQGYIYLIIRSICYTFICLCICLLGCLCISVLCILWLFVNILDDLVKGWPRITICEIYLYYWCTCLHPFPPCAKHSFKRISYFTSIHRATNIIIHNASLINCNTFLRFVCGLFVYAVWLILHIVCVNTVSAEMSIDVGIWGLKASYSECLKAVPA